MPGGDRTGPAGMGPMTGRATGFCAGYNAPGYATWGGGRGFGGGGRGGGRGQRNRFYATGLPGWQRGGMGGAMGYPAWDGPFPPMVDAEQQLDVLKGQAEYLQNALDSLRKQITEVEASTKED
jgi:uncharacterized protein DUF5320